MGWAFHNSVPNNPDAMTDEEVLVRIERLTHRLMGFWKNAHGWASIEAAGLLNKSMLEVQSSLATSLKKWVACESDGDLVLAWVNLGTLVEGALKLHLSVFYDDYKADPEAVKVKGKVKDPDGVRLNDLKMFFEKRIWAEGSPMREYVKLVQERRNTVHAFKDKEIGSFAEFKQAIRQHLIFLRSINAMLPYPDDMYQPRED
ncbi:hypothetical protein AWB71_05296 [Caballeronia peredens]|nr:hypothetical protein AWB71_05296 [Caballeronia peredens]